MYQAFYLAENGFKMTDRQAQPAVLRIIEEYSGIEHR